MRLRGGAAGSSKSNGTGGVTGSKLPKGTEPNQEHNNAGLSYKNILQGKAAATAASSSQTHNNPNPYIVEQANYVPELEIDIPETNE